MKVYGVFGPRQEPQHVHKYPQKMNRYCGAYICAECGDHKGLERCYCGWSRTSPGRGQQELIEMGERIDDDY